MDVTSCHNYDVTVSTHIYIFFFCMRVFGSMRTNKTVFIYNNYIKIKFKGITCENLEVF